MRGAPPVIRPPNAAADHQFVGAGLYGKVALHRYVTLSYTAADAHFNVVGALAVTPAALQRPINHRVLHHYSYYYYHKNYGVWFTYRPIQNDDHAL